MVMRQQVIDFLDTSTIRNGILYVIIVNALVLGS